MKAYQSPNSKPNALNNNNDSNNSNANAGTDTILQQKIDPINQHPVKGIANNSNKGNGSSSPFSLRESKITLKKKDRPEDITQAVSTPSNIPNNNNIDTTVTDSTTNNNNNNSAGSPEDNGLWMPTQVSNKTLPSGTLLLRWKRKSHSSLVQNIFPSPSPSSSQINFRTRSRTTRITKTKEKESNPTEAQGNTSSSNPNSSPNTDENSSNNNDNDNSNKLESTNNDEGQDEEEEGEEEEEEEEDQLITFNEENEMVLTFLISNNLITKRYVLVCKEQLRLSEVKNTLWNMIQADLGNPNITTNNPNISGSPSNTTNWSGSVLFGSTLFDGSVLRSIRNTIHDYIFVADGDDYLYDEITPMYPFDSPSFISNIQCIPRTN